jgi:integrase
MGLATAKLEAAKTQINIDNQIDPLAEKQRLAVREFNTVNDLAEDWLEDCAKRLKYPNIPRRVYTNDIAPSIGALRIEQVNPRDIRAIINKITESGRPTVSNDALLYCKQLFRHSIKLDLRTTNPAEAFTLNDAGGVEESRSRALSLEELQKVFQTFRENSDQFTRDNYLACALLVSLGVRKGELVAAKWEEFDLDKYVWHILALTNR